MFRIPLFPRSVGAIALVSALLSAPAAFAQTAAPASANYAAAGLLNDAAFKSLLQVRGQQAWITTADGGREKVFVVSLASSGVTIAETARTTREIAFDRVVKVETVTHWRRNRLIRGGVIGFGSGFGSMALLLATCWDDECGPSLAPAVGFGALGAGIGVGIGALMNLHGHASDVVYDSRRATRTFSVAPILSPTRKGVAASMTWR